jgi:hypothetical protein
MLRGEGAPRGLLVLAITLTATWVLFSSFRPSGSVDLWWTLRVGDHIRSHGDVPRTTLWTMPAVRDLPYLAHGWMATVVFSGVADSLGLDAVPAVPCLLGLGVLAAVLWLGRLTGVSPILSVGLALMVLYPLLPRLMNRAESFGYLCFALALCVVAAFARRRRPALLLWLVPLAVLWANLHGSFLILLGFPPLLAAGLFFDSWRTAGYRVASVGTCLRETPLFFLALLWLACFAATLLNPYGPRLLASVLEQSSSPLWELMIQEWSPLYSRDEVPLRFWAPLGAAVAALVAARRRVSGFSLLLAGVCFGLAVSSYRHVSLVGLGSVLLFADFAKGVDLDRRGRLALGATLSAGLLLASLSAAARRDWPARSLERHPSPYATPEGVEYIRRHLRGNVLNDWSLGGLLIYFAHPQVRVAIDSRADPYPPAYVRAWWRAITGSANDTLGFVDRYEIDHIIVARGLYSLWIEPKLEQLTGFRTVYTDGRLVVLSRPPVGGNG